MEEILLRSVAGDAETVVPMRVYITGDTHGQVEAFRHLADFAHARDLTDDDIIIVAGDAGIYYGGLTMGSGRKVMEQAPCRFLIVRGNHDDRISDVIARSEDPTRWEQGELLGNTVYFDRRSPTVFYALDGGGLYEIYGDKVLFVPGAYSIDTRYRLEWGLPYNPDEQLTCGEMDDLLEVAERHPDIAAIIAHTAPLSWEPYFDDLFFKGVDQSLVDKSTDRFLDVLIALLPDLKYYYFGHFHDDRNVGDDGIMLFHEVIEYGKRMPKSLS